jgi:hypothetical protein
MTEKQINLAVCGLVGVGTLIIVLWIVSQKQETPVNVSAVSATTKAEAPAPASPEDIKMAQEFHDEHVLSSLDEIHKECKDYSSLDPVDCRMTDAEWTKAKQDALKTLKHPRIRQACADNNWDMSACRAMDARQVQTGMTAEQIRLSWGNPTHINSSFVAGHTSEQWIYEEQDQYLYLDDGHLTSWQTNR